VLQEERLATLLMDLLTPQEERIDIGTAEFRFDIALLAERLIAACDWLAGTSSPANFPLAVLGQAPARPPL